MEQIETVDAFLMAQEDSMDPRAAARKSELLAKFGIPLNNRSNDSVRPVRSLRENDSNSAVSFENNSLQDGWNKGSACSENSLKVDSNLETYEKCAESESQHNNTANSKCPEGESRHNYTVNNTNSEVEPKVSEENNEYINRYNFDKPFLALRYEEAFKTSDENFTKGCKWSPDSTCLLVGSDDRKLRLFNLPTQVASGDFLADEKWFAQDSVTHSHPAVTITEGELIYDYTWYPHMHSSEPESCCFAVTCRDLPVHLWDAWTGRLVCSYQPYDHLDQLVAANSIGFNLDGSLLFCGFKKYIRIFRTSRPGRHCEVINAKEQPGIISCMAFNPKLPSVFAAGSYLGNICFYSTERNNLFCRIEGCPGGITQVQFSPDGTKLYSGARKDSELLCWDVRNIGKILWRMNREVTTHQRMHFDLEPHLGRYVVSGTTRGAVLKWDLHDLSSHNGEIPVSVEPKSSFVAHNDCCNGISINPNYPVLATSSGQRHFPEPQSISDTDSDAEEDYRPLFTLKKSNQECTVKLWWLG